MENEDNGLGRMYITSLKRGDMEGVPSPEQWRVLCEVDPVSSAPCNGSPSPNSGWPSFKASFTLDCSTTSKDIIAAYHFRRIDLIAHRRRWYRFLYRNQHYKGPHYCTLHYYAWAMALLEDDVSLVYDFRKSFDGLFFINHRRKMRKVRIFRKRAVPRL